MNWLDQAIGALAPGAALRRARQRHALATLQRAYEGGAGRPAHRRLDDERHGRQRRDRPHSRRLRERSRRRRAHLRAFDRRSEPGELFLDPEADILSVRAGVMTLKEAIVRQGYDPAQVLAEIAATNAELDASGFVLDTDPRRSTRKPAGA